MNKLRQEKEEQKNIILNMKKVQESKIPPLQGKNGMAYSSRKFNLISPINNNEKSLMKTSFNNPERKEIENNL